MAYFVCMNMVKYIVGFFSILPFSVTAQQPVEKNIPLYPQQYFRNPLNIPILLAGNFGECRPGHFHSGIDIKTNGKENQPVYAAADGYVSRIKMEKGGFGHALYITHPNGFTTLYAHLNRFQKPLQQFLEKTQYEKESWAVDITLQPDQFPVRKGAQIAWSGNTGASTAPHLHFEIRDTETEHPLNPMLFGLPITDKTPPLPTQLALYDLNNSIYEQAPQIIKLVKNNDHYTVSGDTVVVHTDKLGIALNIDDFMDGSTNTLNFYTANWYFDQEIQGGIMLDDIGYDETRYLHAYVDYKLKKQNGNWYQLLFELPGNKLDNIYRRLNKERGGMMLEDTAVHFVRVEILDANENHTTVSFYVKVAETGNTMKCTRPFLVNTPKKYEHPNIKFSMKDNALYDDICFTMTAAADAEDYSDRFGLQNSYIPVHSYFDLYIKPNKPVPFALRDKIVMMYNDGRSEDGTAATSAEGGWYKCSTRAFGTYWLIADTLAPEIKPLQKNGTNFSRSRRLSFMVKEGATSVKSFRADLDGKWLCFEPRGNMFFYDFDEHCSKGKHKLTVTATDENGNKSSLIFTFTR